MLKAGVVIARLRSLRLTIVGQAAYDLLAASRFSGVNLCEPPKMPLPATPWRPQMPGLVHRPDGRQLPGLREPAHSCDRARRPGAPTMCRDTGQPEYSLCALLSDSRIYGGPSATIFRISASRFQLLRQPRPGH